MLRANLKWKLVSQVLGSCLFILLTVGVASCEQSPMTNNSGLVNMKTSALATTDGPLSEVNVPDSIAKLVPSLDKFQPQVQILSPQPDKILTDDRVSVKLEVSDLPIFKSPELGLGNHLHVILDKQTDRDVYDLSQPLVFENLSAGTHTLRVFAARPWHESFKNEGAYAQTTFHVLTKTSENNPDPQQPLLTYGRPLGTYGVEPIMLDYYLTNAPSHLVANGSSDSLSDWRIRATVNDQQFIIDRWAPVYLQGFRPGKNWVRLELVDDLGNAIPNVYNDVVSIFTYDPQTKDTLAKLTKGELNPNLTLGLIDPDYIVATTTPVTSPVAIPTPIVAPTPILPPTPQPIPSPSPVIAATPQPIPNPVVIAPEPVAIPSPVGIVQPENLPSPAPLPITISPPLPPIVKPTPMTTPEQKIVRTPVGSTPPQISIPSPIITPEPNSEPFVPATSIPRTPATTPPPQVTRLIEPNAITAQNPIAIPPVEQEQKTWQDRAIELINIAGVKIRAFTHTIPGKAQRFGHNVQVWTGKVIETVQSWRNTANEA